MDKEMDFETWWNKPIKKRKKRKKRSLDDNKGGN